MTKSPVAPPLAGTLEALIAAVRSSLNVSLANCQAGVAAADFDNTEVLAAALPDEALHLYMALSAFEAATAQQFDQWCERHQLDAQMKSMSQPGWDGAIASLTADQVPLRMPIAHLRSLTHPDWLELCEADTPGAFPVYP